jgi:hypothetical protein
MFRKDFSVRVCNPCRCNPFCNPRVRREGGLRLPVAFPSWISVLRNPGTVVRKSMGSPAEHQQPPETAPLRPRPLRKNSTPPGSRRLRSDFLRLGAPGSATSCPRSRTCRSPVRPKPLATNRRSPWAAGDLDPPSLRPGVQGSATSRPRSRTCRSPVPQSPSQRIPNRRAAGDFDPPFFVLELRARQRRVPDPEPAALPSVQNPSRGIPDRRAAGDFAPPFSVLELRARQPWSPKVFRLGIKSSRPCDRTGNHFLRRRAVVPAACRGGMDLHARPHSPKVHGFFG